MTNRLIEIYDELKRVEKELLDEINNQEKKFSYEVREKTIKFKADVSESHRKNMVRVWRYIRRSKLKNLLSAPVIWLCVFPALAIDATVSFFQWVCFPLYGIPKVKRSDYIVLDRKHLKYLNSIQKLNCLYCGYFNGLVAYLQEVAGRTEQYWCPIKHASKLKAVHSRYTKFLDFGDYKDYQERVLKIRQDFDDVK